MEQPWQVSSDADSKQQPSSSPSSDNSVVNDDDDDHHSTEAAAPAGDDIGDVHADVEADVDGEADSDDDDDEEEAGDEERKTGKRDRKNRPIIERKRRQRINDAIEAIRQTLHDACIPNLNETLPKMEKAVVLETVIPYFSTLLKLRKLKETPGMASSAFIEGYADCVQQILSLEQDTEMLDSEMTDLLSFMKSRLQLFGTVHEQAQTQQQLLAFTLTHQQFQHVPPPPPLTQTLGLPTQRELNFHVPGGGQPWSPSLLHPSLVPPTVPSMRRSPLFPRIDVRDINNDNPTVGGRTTSGAVLEASPSRHHHQSPNTERQRVRYSPYEFHDRRGGLGSYLHPSPLLPPLPPPASSLSSNAFSPYLPRPSAFAPCTPSALSSLSSGAYLPYPPAALPFLPTALGLLPYETAPTPTTTADRQPPTMQPSSSTPSKSTPTAAVPTATTTGRASSLSPSSSSQSSLSLPAEANSPFRNVAPLDLPLPRAPAAPAAALFPSPPTALPTPTGTLPLLGSPFLPMMATTLQSLYQRNGAAPLRLSPRFS